MENKKVYKGFLIYNKEDYIKNKWFAEEFLKYANIYNMDIKLVLTCDITLGIDENNLFVELNRRILDRPDFVINRSRDSVIATHFETMGVRVFNSSIITEICNNKLKTHQKVNGVHIKSVKTLLSNKKWFSINNINLKYPIVLKTSDGHGGKEVYKLSTPIEISEKIDSLKENEFLLQEMCSNVGKDIRVFVMGKEIIGSVKRYSEKSFKSNFSLGGKSEKYKLKNDDEIIVQKIINLFDFDFVGIDFILDENEKFLFNEIEDVVGTRTLYKNYDIDVVARYLDYIKTTLFD